MATSRAYMLLAIIVLSIAFVGCARAAKDTTGFALNDTTTVEAGFDQSWQAVKAVLRDRDLEIYTRDKRGLFVAYSDTKRRIVSPTRTRYTIELTPVSDLETGIAIETIREVYGVTFLTQPDWHARKAKDNVEALAILDAVKAKLAAPAEAETAPAEAAPAPAEDAVTPAEAVPAPANS